MFAVNQRNSCPYFSFDALEAPQPDEASSELCATLEVLRECASTKTDVFLPEHRIFALRSHRDFARALGFVRLFSRCGPPFCKCATRSAFGVRRCSTLGEIDDYQYGPPKLPRRRRVRFASLSPMQGSQSHDGDCVGRKYEPRFSKTSRQSSTATIKVRQTA